MLKADMHGQNVGGLKIGLNVWKSSMEHPISKASMPTLSRSWYFFVSVTLAPIQN